MDRNELQQRRAKLQADAENLLKISETEDRELNDAERQTLEQIQKDVRAVDARLAVYTQLDEMRAAAPSPDGRRSAPMGPHNDPDNTRDHRGGQHQYSFLRAIRLQMEGHELDGLEAEYNQEATRERGESPQGVYAPWDVEMPAGELLRARHRLARDLERRDLDTTTGVGSVMTATPATLIDVLRARMLMATLGAPVMSGLQGKFALPRKTAANTFAWVAEGNSHTATNVTLDSVPMEPKSVIGASVMSRKFIKQTSLDAEILTRRDLMDGLAVELDRIGFNGSGSGAQPRGVLQTSGVTSVDHGGSGGPPTWAKIVEFERVVDAANGLQGSLAYVTTPACRGKLKTVERATNTGLFLWDVGSNLVNGYPAYATTSMPSNLVETTTGLSGMIFGNFEDVAYGLWGPMDLLVNPYAGDLAGSIRLVLIQDADFIIRRNASFARAVDINTT
jgi:HK97 family phage major capsid protein